MADPRRGSLPTRVHHPNGDVTAYGEPVRLGAGANRPAASMAAPARAPAAPGASVGFMIFCGAVVVLFSMGVRNVTPLWQTPMLQELGWTSLQFSIALAAQNLVWGAFSPIFGAVADKFGATRVLIFGAALQAGGLWLMSHSNDPTTFFLTAGVMIGLAQSAGGMSIMLGAIGRVVHERHRSMAFGVITSASSAGMVVMTPVGRALLETQGWSDGFVGLAIIAVPMIVLSFFIRSRRQAGDLSAADVDNLTIGAALAEAVRHRGYVLLVIGFFVCGFHVTFISVHLPKYLDDIGLGWQLGATAFMIIGVFNVAACLAVGFVATAASKKGVLAAIYLGRAITIMAFVMAPVSEWSVYLFAAAMGVFWLSTIPPTQGIVAQVFGPQYMSMLFGVAFFSHQIGSFLGVYLGAEAVDRLGSYDVVWYIAVGLGLFAAVCHVLIDEKPVRRARPEVAPAE